MTLGIRQKGVCRRYNELKMHLLPLHRRLLLIFGLATWLVASMPTLWDVCNRPPLTSVPRFGLWLGSFVVFGLAFWLTFRLPRTIGAVSIWRRNLTLIVIQTVAALLMVRLVPCYSIGIVLVVVAWQVALLLPLRLALGWIAVQTSLLAAILFSGLNSGMAIFALNTSLAFQLFAFITASVAKSESNARSELALTPASDRDSM